MRVIVAIFTLIIGRLFSMEVSPEQLLRQAIAPDIQVHSECENCMEHNQSESVRCEPILAQNNGQPNRLILSNSEALKTLLEYRQYCLSVTPNDPVQFVERRGLPESITFPRVDCTEAPKLLGQNNLDERILLYGNFLRRNVNDLSGTNVYPNKITTVAEIQTLFDNASEEFCFNYYNEKVQRQKFATMGSMQDCQNVSIQLPTPTLSNRFVGGVGINDYERIQDANDPRLRTQDGQTWRIQRRGYAIVEQVQRVLINDSLSCEQKQTQIQAIVGSIEVDLIEDYVLWTYLKEGNNFRTLLDNPYYRQVLASAMSGGDIDIELFKTAASLATVGEGLKIRNGILQNTLNLIRSEPYNLTNSFDVANLSREQQQNLVQQLSASVPEQMTNPEVRNRMNEEFRSRCDRRVSQLFTDGGFCTVSGAAPVRHRVDGVERGVPGIYNWGGYDSGWDGRFHCYVDEALSSRTSDEERTLYRPNLNQMTCFQGRTTNLPRLSIAHVKTGRGIGRALPNSTPVGTFGGEGGGGAVDKIPENQRNYLHAHFEYVIRGNGRARQRIDPADLFCRGTCGN